jgi:hypothetical protein
VLSGCATLLPQSPGVQATGSIPSPTPGFSPDTAQPTLMAIPTAVVGNAIPRINALAIDGMPAGFGGSGSPLAIDLASIQKSVNLAGFSPYHDNGIVSTISQDGTKRLCVMPTPPSIFNPAYDKATNPTQAEVMLGAENGTVLYGDSGGNPATFDDDIVRTKVISAIPLTGLPENLVCVMTRANDGKGTLEILLFDTDTNTVAGNLKGAFGRDDVVKLQWSAEGPQLVMQNGEGTFEPLSFTILDSYKTPTPQPTLPPTHTPEPTATPRPDFPHTIVDGKVVFDWTADISKIPDLTHGGKDQLTTKMIFEWLNRTAAYGMVTPMPTADSVCPIQWVENHGKDPKGNVAARSLIFRSSEVCTKENSPVRVLRMARGYINFQDGGNWFSFPAEIFAFQVYTPEHPKGKLIPFVVQEGTYQVEAFSNPARYFAPNFDFTDPTLAENGYPAAGAARILRGAGLYDQEKVDLALQDWLDHGYPTDLVDGLILVGGSGTINIQNP